MATNHKEDNFPGEFGGRRKAERPAGRRAVRATPRRAASEAGGARLPRFLPGLHLSYLLFSVKELLFYSLMVVVTRNSVFG